MAIVHGNKSEHLIKQEKKGRFLFWVLLGVFVVIGVIQIYCSLILRERQSIFLFLFILFVIVIIYIVKKAEKKNINVLKFLRGRKGEDAVFYILLGLDNNYHVLRNIKLNEYSDIDFIVVGPKGIFAVEVKSHKGDIDFNGKELTRNGNIFPEKDILKQTMDNALLVNKKLTEVFNNRDYFVNPILVFSSRYARVRLGLKKKPRNVTVIGKNWLLKVINKERLEYDNEKVLEIVKILENLDIK